MSGSANLITLMFNKSNLKNLGMEGHPPEFGIYLSIIKANNLHIKNGNEYEFTIEKTKNKNLRKMYEDFLSMIKKSKEAVNVSDIYAHFLKKT